MLKVTLYVDGMSCGMCEAHVADEVRKYAKVKKITASHKDGTCEFITDETPDIARIKAGIKATGYKVTDVKTEQYEKKGLFGLFK